MIKDANVGSIIVMEKNVVVEVTREQLLVGIVTISDLTGACGLGPDSETSAICTEL